MVREFGFPDSGNHLHARGMNAAATHEGMKGGCSASTLLQQPKRTMGQMGERHRRCAVANEVGCVVLVARACASCAVLPSHSHRVPCRAGCSYLCCCRFAHGFCSKCCQCLQYAQGSHHRAVSMNLPACIKHALWMRIAHKTCTRANFMFKQRNAHPRCETDPLLDEGLGLLWEPTPRVVAPFGLCVVSAHQTVLQLDTSLRSDARVL